MTPAPALQGAALARRRHVAAATWPSEDPLAERLLIIDPRRGRYLDARVRDLPQRLRSGDLLVLNDAATLPASLPARVEGAPPDAVAEVRLLRHQREDLFTAVLFGAGDDRTPTEHRPPPAPLQVGAKLRLGQRDPRSGSGDALTAVVEEVSAQHPRLCSLRFQEVTGAALWAALYRSGRPVQYAYLRGPLSLWHVQTAYAGRPWAVEMPSAGRPLRFSVLQALRARGVALGWLTHGAGLSATGDAALDAALPLGERYDLPLETVAQIERARAAGGRVVAVGTSVVRALEGCFAQHGRLQAGEGETELRLSAAFRPRLVDGLLTGLHEPTASHFDLLQAFVPAALLQQAYDHAAEEGYLCHEFGDSNLILPE